MQAYLTVSASSVLWTSPTPAAYMDGHARSEKSKCNEYQWIEEWWMRHTAVETLGEEAHSSREIGSSTNGLP